MTPIQDYIYSVQKLLPLNKSISFTEAEKRVGTFLEASAILIDYRHELNDQKIKTLSVQSVVYSQEMSNAKGSTMTEKKTSAEASDAYIKAREACELLENESKYIAAYIDLFKDAMIFYRNMCKEGQQ